MLLNMVSPPTTMPVGHGLPGPIECAERISEASLHNDRGNALFAAGDTAAAVAAFLTAISLHGSDANLWNNLGAACSRRNDTAAAEAAWRRAIACDPQFAPALQNLSALLMADGRTEESSLLSCSAFVLPPLAGKSPQQLAIASYRLGRIREAADCYRAWLRAEPDNAYARYLLTACTGENVPAKSPAGFIKTLFDGMAEDFDIKLVGKLGYRGPQVIAALLENHLTADGTLDVLDGGCGTGLCAPVLLPYARRLTGIDLSPGMLAKAAQRAGYAKLVEAELGAYLHSRHHDFDLIVMADTLIYFGDMTDVFAGVRRALRPGGLFAFTVETLVEPAYTRIDYQLQPSSRYGHSRRYIASALNNAGFAVQSCDAVATRQEFGQPEAGLVVLARVLSH